MFAKFMALSAGLFFSTQVFSHQAHKHDNHSESGHHHPAAEIGISDAKVRAFLPVSKSTAGYFVLTNGSENELTLVKATISGLGRVEIHEHVHHNGMMKMQQAKQLKIKAKSQLKFQPGGYHLMAFEPKSPLLVGEQRKLTLYFADGNKVFTMMDVVSLKESFQQHKTEHHHHEE